MKKETKRQQTVSVTLNYYFDRGQISARGAFTVVVLRAFPQGVLRLFRRRRSNSTVWPGAAEGSLFDEAKRLDKGRQQFHRLLFRICFISGRLKKEKKNPSLGSALRGEENPFSVRKAQKGVNMRKGT